MPRKIRATSPTAWAREESDHRGGLLPAPAAGFEDFADLAGKLRLAQQLIGVWIVQIG
jgi:hypothetical protein